MSKGKPKILYLASWYPNRIRPLEGIFIRKHAEAASLFSNVAVLYLTLDPGLAGKDYDIDVIRTENLLSALVYLKKLKRRFPIITSLYNAFRFYHGINLGLKRIKKEFGKPDLIQINVAGRIGLFAIKNKLLNGTPYIVMEHSSTYIRCTNVKEYKKIAGLGERLLTSLNYKYSSSVLAVSEFLCRGIKMMKKIRGECYIIPNVVEIPGQIKLKGDKSPNVKILTVASLNTSDKNILGLIKAFSKVVSKNNVKIELHIVGDGTEKEGLIKYSGELGLLHKQIFFHGYVPNDSLGNYYVNSDFFVMPSMYETFSVVVVEALAHGIPVVSTKCGGPEEIITEETGILVDNLSIDALAEGMEYMAENLDKYKPEILKKYAEERFGRAVIGKKFFDIYNKVLNQ